jgi:transcriptional regulator with XRE-family HTH domain
MDTAPSIPARSAAPTLLQAVREARGRYASSLAVQIGVSETTFSRWENGHQQPSRRHQRRLCELLDVEPAELGFEGDLLEVERRRFVKQLLRVVAVGAAAPLLEPEYEEPLERIALAIRRPSRLDAQTIAHLEKITQDHRELYHQLGPFELLGEVSGHLRTLVLLLADTTSLKLRRPIAAMAGETAGHAAWLSYEIQHRRAVDRHYQLADVAMREAGDPVLQSYVLGFRSIVRRTEGEPGEALKLVQGAGALAARSATATTSSWLQGLEAQALAATGNTRDCFVALKRAEAAIERSHPDEDPAWMYSFDCGRFQILAGSCYRRLGKTKAAERTLHEALHLLGPSASARRCAEVLLELAYVEVQKHDLGRACDLAAQSLSGALEIGSAAGVREVRAFRAHLADLGPRGDASPVANLDERLAAIR